MATSRTRKRPGTGLSPQAKVLFLQLEREYADATPQEWDGLGEHMGAQLDVLAGGSTARRELLRAEFAKA